MDLTDIITITLASIATLIAFIESDEARKLTHQAMMFLGKSKIVNKIYLGLITLFTILGLLDAFFADVLKILEGQILMGVSLFLLLESSIIVFAFTNYKLAQ